MRAQSCTAWSFWITGHVRGSSETGEDKRGSTLWTPFASLRIPYAWLRVNPGCITKGCMKKPAKRDAQTSLRLPSEILDELRKLAESERRTLANYIVVVLEQHVAKKAEPHTETAKKGKR